MAKTEKELNELKEKVEELNKELKELSDDELEQVSGGFLNGHAMRSSEKETVTKIISAGH